MADVTLSNGREITFDLNAISMLEYRGLFDDNQPRETDDEILARAGGLTAAEYIGLGVLDFKRYNQAFFAKAREPVNDPKSENASG